MSYARALRRRAARRPTIDPRPAGIVAQAAGRLNAYYCLVCGCWTVTTQTVSGNTPTQIRCRTDGTVPCEGDAVSLGYPNPWPAQVPSHPVWEWYRPGETELAALRDNNRNAYQKVVAGSLLLRRRYRKVTAR